MKKVDETPALESVAMPAEETHAEALSYADPVPSVPAEEVVIRHEESLAPTSQTMMQPASAAAAEASHEEEEHEETHEEEEHKAARPAQDMPEAPEMSEEPDFGLGIGDILRSDESLKARAAMHAMPHRDGDGRLSIDSILRGETRPVEADDQGDEHEDEDDAVMAMDPDEAHSSGRSGAKTALLVIIVLLLFAAAAGGVYMFMSKNGSSFFASLKPAPSRTETAPDTAVEPKVTAPSSASVTVLVGTTAPETEGAKPFLVSRVLESDGKTSGSFPATGVASSKTDKSTGRATITNTTSKAYTFVATTRLLSKEGVLFRMKTTTPIPANGSVEVDVYADQTGADGDIGPSTFTIPGLPADLQKLITAKSDKAMSGGSGTGKGVSQADIDAAKTSLTEKLRKEAVDNFSVMLTAGEKANADMITAKELTATVPKIGTPGDTFNLTLSLRFKALVIPEKAIAPLLEKAMSEALPKELSGADYSLGANLYTVQAYDTAAGTAEIRVEAPIIRK